MNSLNSVLIEGSVCTTPKIIEKDDRVYSTFTIISHRTTKREKSESRFVIRTGLDIKSTDLKKINKDSSLRVVGRLEEQKMLSFSSCQTALIVIVAEHIEFKNCG